MGLDKSKTYSVNKLADQQLWNVNTIKYYTVSKYNLELLVHFYSATFQKKIFYFLLHYICLTAIVTIFPDKKFFLHCYRIRSPTVFSKKLKLSPSFNGVKGCLCNNASVLLHITLTGAIFLHNENFYFRDFAFMLMMFTCTGVFFLCDSPVKGPESFLVVSFVVRLHTVPVNMHPHGCSRDHRPAPGVKLPGEIRLLHLTRTGLRALGCRLDRRRASRAR